MCNCKVYVLFSASIAHKNDFDNILIFFVFFQILDDYNIFLFASMLLHISFKCLKAFIVFVYKK